METYISILRGINVGGQKKILMAELRKLYEFLGFEDVMTYLQSGNVIFNTISRNSKTLEEKIEKGILDSFGYEVSTIVRDAAYFKQVIENNPFPDESLKDPVLPYVILLKNKPPDLMIKNIGIPNGENGEFVCLGAEVYLYLPKGYGRSKLNANFFEKKLGIPATARNWKSVNALYKIALGN